MILIGDGNIRREPFPESTNMTQDAQSQRPTIVPLFEIPESVSIYEIEAYQALTRFERFIEGSPNDILLVISSAPIGDHAKKAIGSSADKLGPGASRISWACILGLDAAKGAQEEPVPISPNNLHLLIESIDPEAIVAADVGAMSVISEAYGVELSADSSNRVACRTCAAFSNFESMLDNDDDKQKAWQVLKRLFE